MKQALSFLMVVALVASAFVLNQGCSKQSGETAKVQSYQGPGSKWTAQLNVDGSFAITHAASVGAAVDMTVNGTYKRLNTGFVKLTVTSSTGTSGPTAGDTAFGLEIPGFAFLLKPTGASSRLIPMVSSGTCPTADFAANWVAVESDNSKLANSTTADWYGTFTYTSAGVASVATKYSLEANTVLGSPQVLPAATCANGILTIGTPQNADIFLTAANGAVVHTNSQTPGSDGFILAMPQGTFASPSDYAGAYAGIIFNKTQDAHTDNRIQPIAATFAVSGAGLAGTGAKVTDVETGITDPQGATISLTEMDLPSTGFARGTITAGGHTRPLRCMGKGNINGSGKNMLFCIGEAPEDATKHFNVLMVSK